MRAVERATVDDTQKKQPSSRMKWNDESVVYSDPLLTINDLQLGLEQREVEGAF